MHRFTNYKFEIFWNFSGLSDHHHKIYTILKTKSEKFKPKKITYRYFKQYGSDEFKLDIFNSMSAMRTHKPLKTILFQF